MYGYKKQQHKLIMVNLSQLNAISSIHLPIIVLKGLVRSDFSQHIEFSVTSYCNHF